MGIQSTVDLLIITNLDQLPLILQTLFTFFTKQATLMRRSTVLSLPLQLGFPATGHENFPSFNLEFWDGKRCWAVTIKP
jgi:hypothetical protein